MLRPKGGALSRGGFVVFLRACEELELWGGVGGSGRLV